MRLVIRREIKSSYFVKIMASVSGPLLWNLTGVLVVAEGLGCHLLSVILITAREPSDVMTRL